MSDYDFLIIGGSELTRYSDYSALPLERYELYRNLVQLRMVYLDNGFRPHTDIYNRFIFDRYYNDSTCDEKRTMLNVWNLPPLNAYLAVNPLIQNGYKCRVIHNVDAELDLLEKYLESGKPLIGISTTFILQWSDVGKIIRQARRINENTRVVLGGSFIYNEFLLYGVPSFEKHMKKYGIQYILYNYNSEQDLLCLISGIKNKDSPETVNNLAFLDDRNRFHYTGHVWNDPEFTLNKKTLDLLCSTPHVNTIQLRTSSGCPFHCAFCNYPSTAKNHQYSSIQEIKKQLDFISKYHKKIEYLVLIDDTVNVPRKRFYRLVSLLSSYNFKWYAFLRVQFINDTLARDLKTSGCDGLYLGLESGSDTVLKHMNKKATAADYQHGIDSLKKHGIQTFASFVLGFPGENADTVRETIIFIENSTLDYYGLKEFYYLHNSPVFHKAQEYGLVGKGNIWKHNTMSSEEASRMKLQIFHHVNNSIHIDPDMGLWFLILLRSKGFRWKDIAYCQNIINEMTGQDNNNQFHSKEILVNKFIEKMNKYRNTD